MAEGLKARFDTTHQNFEAFQRGSPLPDSLPVMFEDDGKVPFV